MLENFCFNIRNNKCILTIEYGETLYASLPSTSKQQKDKIVNLTNKIIDYFFDKGYQVVYVKKKKNNFASFFNKTEKFHIEKISKNQLSEILESFLFFVTTSTSEEIESLFLTLDEKDAKVFYQTDSYYKGIINITPDKDAQYVLFHVLNHTQESFLLKEFIKETI